MEESGAKSSSDNEGSHDLNGNVTDISPHSASPKPSIHFRLSSPSALSMHAKPCLVNRNSSQDYPDISGNSSCGSNSGCNGVDALVASQVTAEPIDNNKVSIRHDTNYSLPFTLPTPNVVSGLSNGPSESASVPVLPPPALKTSFHHSRPASSWESYSRYAMPHSSQTNGEESAFSVTSPRPRTSISFGYAKNRLSHSRSPPLRRASDGCLLYAGANTFQPSSSPVNCSPNLFRPIDPCPIENSTMRTGRSEQGSGASSSCSGRARSFLGYEDEEVVDYEDSSERHQQVLDVASVSGSNSSTVSNSPPTSVSPNGTPVTAASTSNQVKQLRPPSHHHNSRLRHSGGSRNSSGAVSVDTGSLHRVHYVDEPQPHSGTSSRRSSRNAPATVAVGGSNEYGVNDESRRSNRHHNSLGGGGSLSGRSSGVGDSSFTYRHSKEFDALGTPNNNHSHRHKQRTDDGSNTLSVQNIITIVVDQRRFRVKLGQLRNKPHTMLGRMFSGALPPTHYRLPNGDYDLSGCLLDGLSPDVFGAVVEYYTSGRMRCPHNVSVQEFKNVCDFFLIPFNHRTVQSWNLRAFLHEVSNDGAKEIFERFLEEELLSEMVKSAKLGERECHIVILLDDDVVDWDADNPPQIPENEINSQILYSTQMYRFLKYVENRDVAKQVLQERGLKKIRIGIEGYPTHKEKVKMRSGHRKEVIYNFAQRPFLRMSWEEEENRSRHVDFQFVKSKSNNDLSTLGEVPEGGIIPEFAPPLVLADGLPLPNNGEGDNAVGGPIGGNEPFYHANEVVDAEAANGGQEISDNNVAPALANLIIEGEAHTSALHLDRDNVYLANQLHIDHAASQPLNYYPSPLYSPRPDSDNVASNSTFQSGYHQIHPSTEGGIPTFFSSTNLPASSSEQ